MSDLNRQVHPHHARPFHGHDPHKEELIARWRAEHDAKNRALFHSGMLWLGVLAVCSIGIGAWWKSAVDARHSAREQAIAEQAAMRAELLPSKPLTPESAAALLQRIEADRARWMSSPDRTAVLQQIDRARSIVDENQREVALAAALDSAERQLDAGIVAMDLWRALHERLHSLRAAAGTGPAARLAAVEERVDTGWFDALIGAASKEDPAAALHDLTAAEDLAGCMLAGVGHDRAREQAWRMRLHALTPRFDAASAAAFDAAAAARKPWIDLLPGTQDADWKASHGAAIARTLTGPELSLRCQEGDRAHSAIVALRNHDWYAAQGTVEVKLEAGEAALFFRSKRVFDLRRGGGIALRTEPAEGAVFAAADRPISIEWTIVGDRLTVAVGGDTPQHIEHGIHHDERHGSFGVLLKPGAAIRISNLRVRRLDEPSAHGTMPHQH